MWCRTIQSDEGFGLTNSKAAEFVNPAEAREAV
jgi:hypothetical protein